MTTYSGVIGKRELAAVNIDGRSYYRLNVGLLLSLVLLAFAYVFLANLNVAQKYSLNMRRSEFNTLNARMVSEDQNLVGTDLESLLSFAQKSGMVEAKDHDSILQDGNFALTPPQ